MFKASIYCILAQAERYDKQIKNGTKFIDITEYHARFDGKTIWIKNQPYACFHINNEMPKRRTVSRLQELLMISILEGAGN